MAASSARPANREAAEISAAFSLAPSVTSVLNSASPASAATRGSWEKPRAGPTRRRRRPGRRTGTKSARQNAPFQTLRDQHRKQKQQRKDEQKVHEDSLRGGKRYKRNCGTASPANATIKTLMQIVPLVGRRFHAPQGDDQSGRGGRGWEALSSVLPVMVSSTASTQAASAPASESSLESTGGALAAPRAATASRPAPRPIR